MCGIAGFVESSSVGSPFDPESARALAHRMCAAIRHRGPDDEGMLVEPGVALGMRRLSIIDVATGHQPISNEDGRISVVFNGEIYNFRELRRSLQAAGHRFSTGTDTEVIVHAYEQWGAAAFTRLRGMFALALLDRDARTLLIARDRVGIKPLYYAPVNGRLYFGSEIKSLLCAPDVPRDLNLDALDHYLSFLYAPRDESFFACIRKLPPGNLLTWRHGQISVAPYWEPSAQETFRGSERDAVDQLQDVLTDAVRAHLVSDVPLGAFLSGGIDSSLVVALMSQVSGARVKTFSIGFEQPEYDELAYARRVAEIFGTDHHEDVVRPDGVGVLERIVSHFDEPFGDTSALPTWYVSQLAAREVTVVLSGDGGDEMFGGYGRYIPDARVTAVDRYAPAALRRVAGAVGARLPQGARGKRFLRHIACDARGRYLDTIGFFTADDKAGLLSADLRGQLSTAAPECRLIRHFDRYAQLPWPSQMMRFDVETYLPEDILTKVDRMSMAHSIEARVPLLDNAVIDFASSLPAALKIRDGRRKHVLKEVAARFLPGELSARSLQRGYFQASFIRGLIHEHMSARRDHTFRLWQLVVFERWLQQYVDVGRAVPFLAPSVPISA
jgi:asparagine synthase (glutamine-hydrolysing)